MNDNILKNFSKLKPAIFLLPIFLLIIIVLFLYSNNAMSVSGYGQIQKDDFYIINHYLGQYPNLEYNFTQVGDELIFMSILSVFLFYAPKMWESLISASLVSLIFSNIFKKIFAIPRPAAVLDNNTIIIVGKTLSGNNSLPSGHSITIFTILTVLLYAFMPRKLINKILWIFFIIIIGLILVSSRVGVGAHYPLDVITGSIIGYISGLLGIFISRRFAIWNWFSNKKYYPFFILLFLVSCIAIISKINKENLVIYYLAFICLAISLYKISYVYIKK